MMYLTERICPVNDGGLSILQVAGDLLKQYKRKFEGGALSVTWTYLRESMSTYLSQTNPVSTHREGYSHLRDPRFQLDAFQVPFHHWVHHLLFMSPQR